jgi:hypothetical protein
VKKTRRRPATTTARRILKFDLSGVASAPGRRDGAAHADGDRRGDRASRRPTSSRSTRGQRRHHLEHQAAGAACSARRALAGDARKFNVGAPVAATIPGDDILSLRLYSNTTSTGVNQYSPRASGRTHRFGRCWC